MGVVYQAREMYLDRRVALKVLPHEMVGTQAQRQIEAPTGLRPA